MREKPSCEMRAIVSKSSLALFLEHKHVLERRHDLLHLLLVEVERARDHLELLVLQVVNVLHELADALAIVHGRDLLAEHQIEHLAQRIRERTGEHHEDVHDVTRVGAHCQAVLGARRLRNDLTKDDNEYGGAEGGVHAREQVAQNERARRVHEHVAQQYGAQQEVAALAQTGRSWSRTSAPRACQCA